MVNGCYRGSALATIPLAIASRRNARNELLGRSSALIFLSSRAEKLYTGFDPDLARKAKMIPNFVHPPASSEKGDNDDVGDEWLYAGRLSPEKGILELIESWPNDAPLHVVGDGPLRKACESAAQGKRVDFKGLVERDELFHRLTSYRGLIFPSVATEMYALIYLEALSMGLPTLALSGSSVADDVADGSTGVVFNSFGAVEEGLALLSRERGRFAAAARQRFDSQYSARAWLQEITNVYNSTISANPRS